MSNYYKYPFISPEPTYSIIREELKSYIDTGSVDDLLWPTYTKKCLDKLGKGSYDIVETVLYVEDFEARLPDNFISVREAWLCTNIATHPYRTANSVYSQAVSVDTIQISPMITNESCTNVDCSDSNCDGSCLPELIQAVYKTNNEINLNYKKVYLLKPGNISVRDKC